MSFPNLVWPLVNIAKVKQINVFDEILKKNSQYPIAKRFT